MLNNKHNREKNLIACCNTRLWPSLEMLCNVYWLHKVIFYQPAPISADVH